MERMEKEAAAEAILFATGRAVSTEDLAKAVNYLSKIPDITVQIEAEYKAEEAEKE